MAEEAGEFDPTKEQETKLYKFSKSNFPEGSLGYKIFPDILEGRERPAELLALPIEEINTFAPGYLDPPIVKKLFLEKQLQILQATGIKNLDELLHTPAEELETLDRQSVNRIGSRLGWFLEKNVTVDTYGFMLSRAFFYSEDQTFLAPISIEAEAERRIKVDTLLEKIKPDEPKARNYAMILDRYGLYKGSLMTLKQVARKYGVTNERVRQNEIMFDRRIRYLSRSGSDLELQQFLPFRENSIPLKLGYTCQFDMSQAIPGIDFERTTVKNTVKSSIFELLEYEGIKVNNEPINEETLLLPFLRQVGIDVLDELDPDIGIQLTKTFSELRIIQQAKAKQNGVLTVNPLGTDSV